MNSSWTSATAYTFAFQPIVDTAAKRIVSHEALIRGLNDESAEYVLGGIPAEFIHQFDRDSRAVAIATAARLGLDCYLNLNLMPLGLTEDETFVTHTLETAERYGIPRQKIVLEVTENEMIVDHLAFVRKINKFRGDGVKVALDDFGAGYSGLNLLADFQPDMIKLDMNLVRDIEIRGARQAIVRAILQVCTDLGIDVIAEGVETRKEYEWFAEEGVQLFQGFFFARPAFESLLQWSDVAATFASDHLLGIQGTGV